MGEDFQETTRVLTEKDLDLDHEIEYAFETDEQMSAPPPAGDIE